MININLHLSSEQNVGFNIARKEYKGKQYDVLSLPHDVDVFLDPKQTDALRELLSNFEENGHMYTDQRCKLSNKDVTEF